MKLSAKWLTTLAALALLVVAITGTATRPAQASTGPAVFAEQQVIAITSIAPVVPVTMTVVGHSVAPPSLDEQARVTTLGDISVTSDQATQATALPQSATVLGLHINATTALTLALVASLGTFVVFGIATSRIELDIGRMTARITMAVPTLTRPRMNWFGFVPSPFRTRQDYGAHAPTTTGSRGCTHVSSAYDAAAERKGVVASPNRVAFAFGYFFRRRKAAHPAPA